MEINVKKFLSLLLAENQKQNLVSRKTTSEDLELHIQDSTQVLQWLSIDGLSVIDIGSGAGFPGLILAMVCPQSKITLIESDLRKSSFLEYVSKELSLVNVKVVRERAEVLGQDKQHRQMYDVCTSRAVAAMNVVLEYGIPLVKQNGKILLWKGSSYQQEINEAKTALETLGGQIENSYLYNLGNDRERAIVAVRKVKQTPDQYPRRIGVPAKRPL